MRTRRILFFLFVAALAAGFVSCGGDDDGEEEEVKVNQVTYNNINTKITDCFVMVTEFSGSTHYSINLICEGLAINYDKLDFVGSGYLLYLNIIGVDDTFEGDYVYTSVEPSTPTDVFTGSSLVLIKDQASNPVGFFINDATSISIKKIGEEYELTMKGKDDSGKEISAYYKGKINFHTSTN